MLLLGHYSAALAPALLVLGLALVIVGIGLIKTEAAAQAAATDAGAAERNG